MSLARLVEQAAADDDRGHETFWMNDAEARIAALAPDMAQLLIDMADYIRRDVWAALPSRHTLLTRFAELNARAGADGA